MRVDVMDWFPQFEWPIGFLIHFLQSSLYWSRNIHSEITEDVNQCANRDLIHHKESGTLTLSGTAAPSVRWPICQWHSSIIHKIHNLKSSKISSHFDKKYFKLTLIYHGCRQYLGLFCHWTQFIRDLFSHFLFLPLIASHKMMPNRLASVLVFFPQGSIRFMNLTVDCFSGSHWDHL